MLLICADFPGKMNPMVFLQIEILNFIGKSRIKKKKKQARKYSPLHVILSTATWMQKKKKDKKERNGRKERSVVWQDTELTLTIYLFTCLAFKNHRQTH